MSDKRRRDEYSHRKHLQENGWNINKRDSVAFNSGSETFRHFQAKAISAWYLHTNGYRVDSEVEHPERGEVDVIGYAQDRIVAIECETSPEEGVVRDKLERYVYGTPIDEMFLINVSELPAWDAQEMLEHIDQKLGL